MTSKLTLVFIYNSELRPRQPRPVSEKIKSEIIPLLNDGDNDELDDEVAMISNKKTDEQVSADDIKLEIKSLNAPRGHQEELLVQAEQEVFFESEGKVEERLLQKCIQGIKVIGFNMNQIPAITSMMTFMNNAFLLKNKGHLAEAEECDFMIGVLLISSKRTI